MWCIIQAVLIVVAGIFAAPNFAPAQVLNKQALLRQETFWDNRDFDWYAANIPFFECSDRDITTTYYYRWELLTKHLTYGSANSGYSFTEFIDRPFWSGAYGAISCPAGHQLYEARWLKSPRVANDYSKYWFRTPGAQPRRYSTWLADSIWAVNNVHPNQELLMSLLPDLVHNYEGWEERHFVPEVGLFWQTGHDDGMEFNINSRQTQDLMRGAPSYRPSFNAYMWADAQAIAKIANLAGKTQMAQQYSAKADALKARMIDLMWDDQRQFFFPVLRDDEQRDGYHEQALTKTYETGQFAGDPHGRELIGYVPWQFEMFRGQSPYDFAWKKLMERDGFYAKFGPSTVERNDPMFVLKDTCCWWSGQSWPYATTQTLKGLANSLQAGGEALTPADYVELLAIYARSHRKDGKPYLAEALNPDTGSFAGHDSYNHSEHYFHSGYCDLVITGLVGLVPRPDDTLEIRPLAPDDWEYFALDDVPYHGHALSIFWDKSGERYDKGPGMHVLIDGQQVYSDSEPGAVLLEHAVPLKPSTERHPESETTSVNFAVNNDGYYYPRLTTSYTAKNTSSAKLNDGNYWYLLHPPNRWTCEESPHDADWIEVDFGIDRPVSRVQLYVLDDRDVARSTVRAPKQIHLEYWDGSDWQPFQVESVTAAPYGHRPYLFEVTERKTEKLRVELVHAKGYRSGLTEIEVWGGAELPLPPVPPPAGNLAYNDGTSEFPKATASHHDRFGGIPKLAIDGITNFLPTPLNRWTSYESESETDWLEINFGEPVEFRRVDLAIYDDRGGVQAPRGYSLETWNGEAWVAIGDVSKSPENPTGNQWNSATFDPVTASRLRIVFANAGGARSGLTEVMVWNR